MKRLLPASIILAALVLALGLDYRLWLGQRGDRLYGSGDFSGALSAWSARPFGTAADRFNSGNAAYRMNDFSAATRYFRSASAAGEFPLRHKALYNLGTTQLRLAARSEGNTAAAAGHLRAAVTSLQESLSLAPASQSAAANLKLAQDRLVALQSVGGKGRQKDTKQESRPEPANPEREKSGKPKEADRGGAKPGKATEQDREGGKRRSVPLDRNQALRMLDEARGREALRSAVAASPSPAPANPPEKDW